MNCPYCGYHDSRVMDSREINEGIRRRRQCLGCGARFTTYERIQPVSLFVIKKDNRREVFNREKMLIGLRKACEKRPLPTDVVDRMADEIEAELYRLGRAEIPSTMIGDAVMRRLKGLDHIAYIRFASVYREFTDITALKQEVDTLMDDKVEVAPPSAQLPLLPDEEVEEVAIGGPQGDEK
jgi:transcriptional repressor NrdR